MTIRIPTVLILGAGSSIHCGYPLGLELISKIAEFKRNDYPFRSDSFFSDHGYVQRFVERLTHSGHYSIDAFLEECPEEMDLGKYLIALQLKQLESIDSLFPPPANNSGWYQYLFNSLLSVNWTSSPDNNPTMIRDKTPFTGNKLTIVTYNYDRSLEAYLYHALIARCKMSLDEARAELAKIPIIHVHGVLGAFPEVSYEGRPHEDGYYEKLYEISQAITIIHEIEDREGAFCSKEFEEANEAINLAEKVVFMGFGFHYDNVRRLQVDWPKFVDREVYATFFGITPQKRRKILQELANLDFSAEVFTNKSNLNCDNIFEYETLLE